MMERETAIRVFAREFNDSDMQYGGRMERSPNLVITPTGAACNRIYAVGVLTDIENIGEESQGLWRARVADPTGVFTIYAGQYQPLPAMMLSKAECPSYIAVVGKARVFKPEEGVSYMSIRPEEVNVVDELVRDRWVYNTSRLSLERVKVMEAALASGLRGSELTRHLGRQVRDASSVSLTLDHYNLSQNRLDAYRSMIADALSTLLTGVPATEDRSADGITKEPDAPAVLEAAIRRMEAGGGVSYEDLLEEMLRHGYSEDAVESALNVLMAEGKCYEPRIGVLKLI